MFVGVPMMFYGALAVVTGIFVAWKIKTFVLPPKKATKKSPPLKDNGGDFFFSK